MTAPTHPGDRPSRRALAAALAVTTALSALTLTAVATAAPDSVRTPLLWGGGLTAAVFCAAVATAVQAMATARGTRRRLESVTGDVGRLLLEQTRAAEEARREQQRLIDELAEQRTEFTTDLAHAEETGTREREELRGEITRLAEELERARRDRAAAVSATSNAAGRMQALATATLADLRAMEDRHTDEDVLTDLLQLDHRTAQAGRLADSIAVLTGARSGRRWARPISMESILRGAMGRISGYQRVRVHSASEVAVAGHAAEGVMHALAELLDNAANFSPPTAEVHVYVEEVPAGVIVSVEDSGLVMGDVQLRRAERAVAGDTSELGGLTGTRLGLTVVGRLARKYGLKVSFRPSARGGTGVLMLIPQELLTDPAAPGAAPAATRSGSSAAVRPAAGRPAGPPTVTAAATGQESPEPQGSEGPANLPKRRRGRTLAEAERSRSAPQSDPSSPASAGAEAKTRAARFNSFRQAVRPSAPDDPAAREPSAGSTPDDGTDGSPQGTRDTSPQTAETGHARDGSSTARPADGARNASAHDPGTRSPQGSAPDAAEHDTPTPSPAASPMHTHTLPEGDTTS
ncbi:ATP-binding protein [Streptomyces sp. NBC_00820]|uniref:ATP-binding protein n=1 Tax=Streptomyces sp. NBC_00820 TaxID=2975842 RepID=UPI002ED558BE|nr:ATP-binding protein [Streptomyces sp. NBC_00820]